jgi:hypothetical protein
MHAVHRSTRKQDNCCDYSPARVHAHSRHIRILLRHMWAGLVQRSCLNRAPWTEKHIRMCTREAAPRNKTVLVHNAAVHILEAIMLGSEYVVYGYDLYVHESRTCASDAVTCARILICVLGCLRHEGGVQSCGASLDILRHHRQCSHLHFGCRAHPTPSCSKKVSLRSIAHTLSLLAILSRSTFSRRA